MGFTAFLRRLTGHNEEDLQVEKKFKSRLQDADDKNAELDRVQEQLDGVVSVVGKQQKRALARTLTPIDGMKSADSGEHRLDLEEGEQCDDARQSKPG